MPRKNAKASIPEGTSVVEKGKPRVEREAGRPRGRPRKVVRVVPEKLEPGHEVGDGFALDSDHPGQLHVQRAGNETTRTSELVAEQSDPASANAGGDSHGGRGNNAVAGNGQHAQNTLPGNSELARLKSASNFCEWLIGKLDPWQRAVAEDFGRGGRVALRAANGVGKSKLIAGLVCWCLATVENVRVVMTAGSYRQLEMIHYHLKGMMTKLGPGWQLLNQKLTAPDGCEAVWYSAERADLFEGQHEKNLVLFIDEAKSVANDIAIASERVQPKFRMDCSSTGAAVGWFYDCFAGKSGFYRCHKVTAFDSSFAPREWIEEMREMYGEDSDIFKSAVLAEFTSAEEGAFIPLECVNRCVNSRTVLWMTKPLVAGIDLSGGGGDECVICIRNGNKIIDFITCRETDEMRIAEWCVETLLKRGVPKERIYADAGGLGGPIIARICDLGLPVNRVQFGGNPTRNKEIFGNRMTEIWDDMKRKIVAAEIILPNDEKLITQLTTRLAHRTGKGNLKLEPKALMKRRGLPSPDRADALALALIEPHAPFSFKTSNIHDYFDESGMESVQNRNMLNVSANGKISFGGY